jgi:hypothetical protein
MLLHPALMLTCPGENEIRTVDPATGSNPSPEENKNARPSKSTPRSAEHPGKQSRQNTNPMNERQSIAKQ